MLDIFLSPQTCRPTKFFYAELGFPQPAPTSEGFHRFDVNMLTGGTLSVFQEVVPFTIELGIEAAYPSLTSPATKRNIYL